MKTITFDNRICQETVLLNLTQQSYRITGPLLESVEPDIHVYTP